MMYYSFSIFTPTYNRGRLLGRVFASLQKQVYRNFEWIVVNDGSTDNTDVVMREIIQKAEFSINYIRLEQNSGKHVAQNRAVEVAKGELFVPLDSDDYIKPETLEVFWQAWNSIPIEEREKYSGVGVHCMDQYGNLIGTPFPADRFISNDLDMTFRYNVRGEKWGMIRTDIMREFKNVEVKGHFLSESTIWFRIAQKYPKKLYLQKCLRIYEKQEDSVTKKNKSNDYNIESTILSECIYINEFYNWYLRFRPRIAILKPIALTRKCILNNRKILFGEDALIKKVNPLLCKVLVLLSSPYKLVWIIIRE